jgi:hypothetical protein
LSAEFDRFYGELNDPGDPGNIVHRIDVLFVQVPFKQERFIFLNDSLALFKEDQQQFAEDGIEVIHAELDCGDRARIGEIFIQPGIQRFVKNIDIRGISSSGHFKDPGRRIKIYFRGSCSTFYSKIGHTGSFGVVF